MAEGTDNDIDAPRDNDRFKLSGQTIKGEFRVASFVAEGGFGVVYKAEQVTVGRAAALKVLKTPEEMTDEGRREFLESFAAEARTLGKLAHPNIVQVLDFGVDDMPNGERAGWMALEWIPGETLEDILKARRKSGGRSPAEIFPLVRDMLRPVAFAHDEGVAHRDLKPANVMLIKGKREVQVRLLDFGIAKMMSPDETAGSGATRTTSGKTACSPRYAAPEQFAGARTGPWSDVHALGMIITEMLVDRPCYPGKTMNAIVAEGLSRTRPSPAKFGVDVGAWEPVLARAVALRPDDRWRDAGAFLDALTEALPGATHPSVVAAPQGPAERPSSPVEAAASLTAPAPVHHTATRPAPMPLTATAVLAPADLAVAAAPAFEATTQGGALSEATAVLSEHSLAPPEPNLALGATMVAAPRASTPGGSQAIGFLPTQHAVQTPVATPVATAVQTPVPSRGPARGALLLALGCAAIVALGVGVWLVRRQGATPVNAAPASMVRAPAVSVPAEAPAPSPGAGPGFVAPTPEPSPEAGVNPSAVAPPVPAALDAPTTQDDEDQGRRRGRRRRRSRRDNIRIE
ncbi:MAG: protein kinase [Myxococcales bacterium]|nr:protein kinase [Myxococcales bacterium]